MVLTEGDLFSEEAAHSLSVGRITCSYLLSYVGGFTHMVHFNVVLSPTDGTLSVEDSLSECTLHRP